MKYLAGTYGLALALMVSTPGLVAQTTTTESKHEVTSTARSADNLTIRTFYLKNASDSKEASEILTAVRIICDPTVKMFLDEIQNALTVRGTDHDLNQVQQILDELDRPKKNYLITYTIVELDGAKRLGVQHFSMNAASGLRVTLKQGSKVPYFPGGNMQFSYLDVGLSFDSTVDGFSNAVRLKSKVEQSSFAPDDGSGGSSLKEPIIRQNSLESDSVVPLGKSTQIGSMDVPGSTRHLDIEVQVDLVK